MSDTGNNTSRSAIPEPVASRGELEAFIDFLNDNEGSGDCAFGKEIEFFERNDFHLSIANQMFLGFKHKVNGFQSPLAIRIPHPEDEINDENGRDDDYVFAQPFGLGDATQRHGHWIPSSRSDHVIRS